MSSSIRKIDYPSLRGDFTTVSSNLNQRALLILGSKSDLEFAEKIRSILSSSYSIPVDIRIASAHRTVEHLLNLLRKYKETGDQIVIVTVAGLSDALSGVVAAQRVFPVIACPPDTDKFGYPKVFSSAFTPQDVPVAFVEGPSKAAHFVAQLFAVSNPVLRASIERMVQEKKEQIMAEDETLVRDRSKNVKEK
jgi:5-(carboxyamino)imidazole ribonucleotide mutase